MTDAVTSLAVLPHFGDRSCVLKWTLDPAVREPSVFVYRSDDNGATWQCLNLETPVTSGSFFIDTGLPNHDMFAALGWRLMVAHRSGQSSTQPVGMFSCLTRQEWAYARAMAITQVRLLSAGRKGLPVFYAAPLRSGVPAANYDELSGQMSGACSPGSAGQAYQGGFHPPWQTWASIAPASPMTTARDEGGAGWQRSHAVQCVLPAWPQPVTGGILVFPTLSERYGIGENIVPYRFKGQAPVVWSVEAELIPRNDPRWEFPVPLLADDNHIPFLLNKQESAPP